MKRLAAGLGVAVLGWSALGSADANDVTRWPLDSVKVNAVLAAPASLPALPDAQLPSPDLTGVPGAKILLRRGVGKGDTRVEAVCARADASAWAPGVETLVFDKLDDVMKTELGNRGTVESFHDQPAVEPDGKRFERPFDGTVTLGLDKNKPRPLDTSGLPKARFNGRHTIGFAGEPEEIVACTLFCTDTDNTACTDFAATATIDGDLLAAPTPTAVGRFMTDLAKKPLAAVGVIFGLLLAISGLVVAAIPPRRKPVAAA